MHKRKKIVIIDYELSNLFSVKHACEYLGLEAEITSNAEKLLQADGAILPGVGAFAGAMKNLNKHNLTAAIKKFVNSGRPFMGVCLGMQLIFSESSEFGVHKGLGLIKGKVQRFPDKVGNHVLKVPQIGWNKIYPPEGKKDFWDKTYLKDMEKGQFMYFVHSYFVLPEDSSVTLAKTNYDGFEYASAILKDNIFAVQFHPEKSAEKGLAIYKRFSEDL
jgi:glutamine amidotransferase